ncbi:MAG: hypothetical protein HY898_19455 [Deltaproteobacteria bacterium]|nr:hypothetical protein [Deltaproteobacteria bacterium]
MKGKLWIPCLLAMGVLAGSERTEAATHVRDPAARGLDMFLHVPALAAPGGTLPLQVQALGFPTVVSLLPLQDATVEAVWNPESLGPGISKAPQPVRATADRLGRVHLDVPVPEGDERDLELLVSVRSGVHERVRKLTVKRDRSKQVQLYIADSRVVPGSSISAWVLVTTKASGEPSGSTPIELSLLEGGMVRQSLHLTTDAAGSAMGRIPIPRNDDPTWSWELRARIVSGGGSDAGSASTDLTPREETPGTPRLVGSWNESSVRAGQKATFRFRVRDASDKPVASLPVRYWVGPKGTNPPDDPDEWEDASTLATTDGEGEIKGAFDAPSTVPPVVGTSLHVMVKTTFDGHELKSASSVHVGSPTPQADLMAEAGNVIPGIDQRVLLRVTNEMGKPVVGPFSIKGDGLNVSVTTDAAGEAEFSWHPPVELGAFRNAGPCAGGVASAVIVRPAAEIPSLGRTEPFELCVPVDRDAAAVVRTETALVRAGDKVKVRVLGGARLPWSLVIRSSDGGQSVSAWIDDGEQGGEIELPQSSKGLWTVSASSPGRKKRAAVVGATFMVVPRTLPKLEAKMTGGRAAPGGTVDIEADLTDGHGHGITGTVAALVIDLNGGGSVQGLWNLDTRRELCWSASIEEERCDKFLEDAAMEPVRRAAMSGKPQSLLAPHLDPGSTAEKDLIDAFGTVVKSLEGALYEATESAERLRDARRKGPNGWTFNPELWTLVTSTLNEPPSTPGGELLSLQDLMDVDPQVSFENVARRVTRLKLFRILVAVRGFVRERNLDPDEPALKDPNAILRRLVRDGKFQEGMLLDPWGGTIQFIKSNRPPIPFINVRGFELHSPGPDRVVGNGDDVIDPFARVLKTGTPYAKAVSEDEVADARLDMEVSDATISNWEGLFNRLWGDHIGDSFGAGGLGMAGIGEGGGGRGEGIGLGSIGTIGHGAGTGRATFGISTGVAYWAPPRRTDAHGHVKFAVPLGAIETTWRVALVGVPDRARPATTQVDVTSNLPISARVESGPLWVEGDLADVGITVHNRTPNAVRASLSIAANGVGSLMYKTDTTRSLTVPGGGATTTSVRVQTSHYGKAGLDVRMDAQGLASDTVHHSWEVKPAGDPMDVNRAVWVDGEQELSLPLDESVSKPFGPARLVFERGAEPLLTAAMESLDPDLMPTPDATAHALDASERIRRWAIARGGEKDPMALRAGEFARRAAGRLSVFGTRSKDPRAPRWKALAAPYLSPPIKATSGGQHRNKRKDPAQDFCPPGSVSSSSDTLDWLDLEPPAVAGSVQSCWDAFVVSAWSVAVNSSDPSFMARAVLALLERPHRVAVGISLLDRLRERVGMRPSGMIELSHGDRSTRAMVYAALLRGVAMGKLSTAPPDRLLAWAAVQRDTHGGYGSTLATRSIIRALLAAAPDPATPTQVQVELGGAWKDYQVQPSKTVAIGLGPGQTKLRVKTSGPGLIARLERKDLRLWSRPTDESASPIRMDIDWPDSPYVGGGQKMRVTLRHNMSRETTLDVRIPLPPGVTLAAPVEDVRQVQGVLTMRKSVDSSALPTLIEIPVRFTMSGRMTVPVGHARLAFEESGDATAPARPLVIQPTAPPARRPVQTEAKKP